MSKCRADCADPRSSQQHQCRNKARYGEYCGTHSPAEQARRRKARENDPRTSFLHAARIRGRRKAALDRVLYCAREIAEREPALRAALERYDRIKK